MNKQQFDVIKAVHQQKLNATDIFRNELDISNNELQDTINYLQNENLISKELHVTEAGYKAMEPYKVDNAIIMAAGISSRCLPFSKIIPKGLFRIKEEILIERQIKQLQSAGINQIILVVGYLKEKFLYLKDKFSLIIIENDDFIERNNNHSLFLAQKYLKNSYICCSDIYYPQNIFSLYEYDSYFACKYSDEYIDEYCITETRNDYITNIQHGAKSCWYTMGHVYFSKAVSQKFNELLNIEHDLPEVKKMIFDDFHIKHIDKLPARINEYKDNDILEFDTLQEAIDFDGDFRQFIVDNSLKDWVDDYSGIKRYNTVPTDQKNGRLHLNENLFLPSPVCLDILKNISLEDMASYDASGNDILETELCRILDLNIQNIFIHNGSSDVIKTILNLLLKKEHSVLIPNLAWNYYKAISSLKFTKCLTYNIIENDNVFSHDIGDILEKAKKYNPKVIIITTPNNPTGNTIDDASLKKIISENPHSLILVDEAYWGFSDIEYNYKEYLNNFKNVVFARTLSKFYGLAGVRIGFGICSDIAKEIIDLDIPVFRTSIISRKLGVAVLRDVQYYNNLKREIIKTREWFISELNKITSIKAFLSNSNFVFIKFHGYNIKEVKSWFDKKGILVRLVLEETVQGLRITIAPKKYMEEVLNIIYTNIRHD
jgi:histidinol-phosphate aminotransferase